MGELLGRHYVLSRSARFWDSGPAGPTMRAIGTLARSLRRVMFWPEG